MKFQSDPNSFSGSLKYTWDLHSAHPPGNFSEFPWGQDVGVGEDRSGVCGPAQRGRSKQHHVWSAAAIPSTTVGHARDRSRAGPGRRPGLPSPRTVIDSVTTHLEASIPQSGAKETMTLPQLIPWNAASPPHSAFLGATGESRPRSHRHLSCPGAGGCGVGAGSTRS